MAKQDEMRNDGMQEMNEQELDKVVGGQSVIIPYEEWEGEGLRCKLVRCSTPECKAWVTVDIKSDDSQPVKCGECKRREGWRRR